MLMLPQRTRRLVKEEATASYVYREVPLAAPQGDELLVKVGKVALCGTDINLYQWNQGIVACITLHCSKGPFSSKICSCRRNS